MAQCSSKYALGVMSLANDQFKTVVRAYCVFAYHQHDEQKLSKVEFRKFH